MKRYLLEEGYVARNVERAVEAVIGYYLGEAGLSSVVYKYAYSCDSGSREIKWDICLSEEEVYEFSKVLNIPYLDSECCGEFVVVTLLWDVDSAEEQFELENKIVSACGELLGYSISEGVEDGSTLESEYCCGEVELIKY